MVLPASDCPPLHFYELFPLSSMLSSEQSSALPISLTSREGGFRRLRMALCEH